MFYKYHNKSPWLGRVLVPFWTFQFIFVLTLAFVFIWFRADSGFQTYVILCTSPLDFLHRRFRSDSDSYSHSHSLNQTKQYRNRHPHNQRHLHDPLPRRNHTIGPHQAPSLDILNPPARQDGNLVRAVRASGR